MILPILEPLKRGEKFDFQTLVDNIDQTDQYWEWWWDNKAEEGKISRPEIISDDDPMLVPTAGKACAHLCSFRELFDRPLYKPCEDGLLPIRDGINRDQFRERITQLVWNSSINLQDSPQILFMGGGYGSGKTTTLNYLSRHDCLPVPTQCLIGADVFKQLIPEYNLIKAVADGRASLTVQEECVILTSELVESLIRAKRSFVLDSSMSNHEETTDRIAQAKAAGYELTMVAVLTPMKRAIHQAMMRAKRSRRFPHPKALPESHVLFIKHVRGYIDQFDTVRIFANLEDSVDVELIAEKRGGKELEIMNAEVFNSADFCPPA